MNTSKLRKELLRELKIARRGLKRLARERRELDKKVTKFVEDVLVLPLGSEERRDFIHQVLNDKNFFSSTDRRHQEIRVKLEQLLQENEEALIDKQHRLVIDRKLKNG